MRTRITEIWATIIGGLWFLPMVMVTASFILAISTLWLDAKYTVEWGTGLGLTYASSIEGGRAVLSTIAGSMMTVTGVVFSITIVILSLTSSQYGPRLLRNFLNDRGNQIVLGTFLGTFTYALLVLRSLQDTGEGATAPEISIAVGAVLALVSLGVLIYFIHHISDAIQATSILSSVGGDLNAAVERLYPEQIGEASPHEVNDPLCRFSCEPRPITMTKAGYVRAIDPEGMMTAAIAHDATIRIETRPGRFVFQGGRIGDVWSPEPTLEDLEREVQAAIVLGKSRTPFQDIEFLMSQLVQAALIALSPGVNNALVAVTAFDWIGATLARLAERDIPSPYRHDDEGKLRVISQTVTFTSLLEDTFNPLRESAHGNTLATMHLLDTIGKIAPHASRDSDRESLRHQAQLIREGASTASITDYDRSRINEKYRAATKVLATTDPPSR